MEPIQLQRFQSALVIPKTPSDTPREKRARPQKNRDVKRIAPSRRAGRSWVEFASKEANPGGRPPYTFNQDLVTPTSKLPVGRPQSLAEELPAEILSQIFLYCLPDHFFFLPRSTAAPLLLCQICGYWRQVALATPKLWVIVSVQGRKRYDSSYLSLLRMWMERSLDHSIFLHFGGAGFRGDDPAFELFLNHSHHWRYLSLTLSDSIANQLLTAPITGSPLTTLRLDASSCSDAEANEIAELLNCFPHLRRFQFTRSSETSTSFENTRWSHMTHIWLNFRLDGNECIDILAGCSQVEDFRLAEIATPADHIVSREIVLPNLSYLQLSSLYGFQTILDRLTCPALRTLNLKTIYECSTPYSEAVQSFVNFLSLSGCKLEKFSIHEDDLPEDSLISYLQTPALKSLRELELECQDLGPRTLELFKYPEDANAGILLPSLHTVWLRSSAGENDAVIPFEVSQLDKLLSSTPLKNVYFSRNRLPVFREGKIQVAALNRVNASIARTRADRYI